VEETDDVLREFLAEGRELLDQVDEDLLALEAAPDSVERIASVFRALHSIKGGSGLLGLARMQEVAHAGESLLVRLRDGAARLDRPTADALLALNDALRARLDVVAATGAEDGRDDGPLLARLAERAGAAIVPEPTPTPKLGAILVAEGRAAVADVAAAAAAQRAGDGRKLGEILTRDAGVPPEAVRDALAAQETARAAETSIRTDVGLLDRLINLVGELVLARNQILQHAAKASDPSFVSASLRLNLITSELQEGIMKTRMQPVGAVFGKLPRMIRDLAATCGRSVRVETSGAETELDRTLVEAVKDPIAHIVRNAVDHGVEPPAVRAAAGKPETGVVRLRAFHEGGKVVVEISDDGAGIDAEKLRRAAVEKGLVPADRAARLTTAECLDLVFLPGFSTAEKVTNVSGRGVGMDVVRTNVERIGGAVDVRTAVGAGTTFRLRIPLTLAIIPALMVRVGAERFAIPQANLLELVRLDGGVDGPGVERAHGAPVFRLRGRLLPLLDLRGVLGAGPRPPSEDPTHHLVVLQADDRRFGLVVDAVLDTEEIVVKPLGRELKGLGVYAGATIMGDGRVALILDVPGVARRAGVGAGAVVREPKASAAEGRAAERGALLLFRARGERMALPLDRVARLEEFPAASVERAAGEELVQYRDELLPLVRLSGAAGCADGRALPVVVVRGGEAGASGAGVGLVVDAIDDIVDAELKAARVDGAPGTAGCAVVQGRATTLLDVDAAVRPATGAGERT
jgi:two-component system chemotaxis sensor kinase CheA